MRASGICDTFDQVWDENDEKSTEWLLVVTADRCSVSYDQVVGALHGRLKPTKGGED